MNLKDPSIQLLLEEWGTAGLGTYILIKHHILEKGSSRLSDIVIDMSPHSSLEMVLSILNNYNFFYTLDGILYKTFSFDKNNLTVDDSDELFNRSSLRGRFFSKLKTIYTISEKEMMDELAKWKERNKGIIFKDERHLENSFSYWLKSGEFTGNPQKSKTTIDWDSV